MDAKVEQLASSMGETTDAILASMNSWHPQKSKKIVQASILLAIEERRTKIEHCSTEELVEFQGVIKGLRIALGCLNVGLAKEDR